jgi:hypothetical protein
LRKITEEPLGEILMVRRTDLGEREAAKATADR